VSLGIDKRRQFTHHARLDDPALVAPGEKLMWRRILANAIACIVFSGFYAPAFADPILYDVDITGIPGGLPSWLQGGLPSVDLIKNANSPYQVLGSFARYGGLPLGDTVPIQQTMMLDIHPIVGQNADGSSIDAPGITVTVPISGLLSGQYPDGDLNGGWQGTGQSATLDDPGGPPVPQALLNLLANPAGVSIFGIVAGGGADDAANTLTIDPLIAPAAIPEPTTLAITLTAIAAYAARRRWSRSRR
jgi:hypothetical protein